MADFCKECSIEIFNKDFEDFVDSTRRKLTEKEKEEGYGWSVICEGCGYILVDDEGKRIGPSIPVKAK